MKRTIFSPWLSLLSLIFIPISKGLAQVPIPYVSSFVSSGNIAVTFGNNNLQFSSIQLGPTTYNINGTTNFDASAHIEIDLTDGFRAGAFSGTGYAHLQIGGMSVASFNQSGFNGILQYERFELGVHLPSDIQNKIDNFLNPSYTGTDKLNPYDPDQIKIRCDFTNSGSNFYTRYGFYYVPFTTTTPDPSKADLWVDQQTDYSFRVRFAPPLTGSYNGWVSIDINNQPSGYSTPFTLNVVSSSNKGHLQVTGNPQIQKLQYPNGDIFFAIGTNIPWADQNIYHGLNGALVGEHPEGEWNGPYYVINNSIWEPSSHNTHELHRQYISALHNNSGNFARVRLDEWSVPIETVNFRDQNCMTQKQKYLTNYHHNQQFMWEMDKTLETCESLDMKLLLSLNLQTLLTNDWDLNPYSGLLGDLLISGFDANGNPSYNASNRDNFFDVTANRLNVINIYKKRLFYIVARWGYSTSIGLWELINETEFIFELPNGHFNGNLPDIVKDWHCEMANYLRSFYPVHPVTTGAINLDNPWKSPGQYSQLPYINEGQTIQNCLDVFTAHSYFPEWSNGYVDGTNIGLDQLAIKHSKYWVPPTLSTTKPFIWGEFANAIPELRQRSRFSLHDAIWHSIFANSIGVALHWDNWRDACSAIPTPDLRNVQYQALSQYVNRVNFNQLLLPDRNVISSAWRTPVYSIDEPLNSPILTYWMRNSNSTTIYGWTRNTSANWTIDSYWDKSPGQTFRNCALSANGERWINNAYSNCGPVPCCGFDPNNMETQGYCGSQCKTVLCPHMDISQFPVDLPGTIHTVLLQGLLRNSSYCIDVYDTWDPSGNKLMTLSGVSDNSGKLTFSLEMPTYPYQNSNGKWFYPDYAFIATNSEMICEGEGSRTTGSFAGISSNEIQAGIRIFPNPAKDKLLIEFQNSKSSNVKIAIVDEMGREFDMKVDQESSIDLRKFANGYYTLRISTPTTTETFKLIIQK